MSKPFECFFPRRREKFFELLDALWEEEQEKGRIEFEKLMDWLRSMGKVTGYSPIEEF